jgi:hypothetical protein
LGYAERAPTAPPHRKAENAMKKDPKEKKFSLKKEFNETFRNLTWKEARKIAGDTLKDLKRPKEIFTLVAAVALLPGGLVIYPAYRIRKYRGKNKPANDDKPPQP